MIVNRCSVYIMYTVDLNSSQTESQSSREAPTITRRGTAFSNIFIYPVQAD